MALPLKSGADLYNNQALRMRLHNLGADPTEVGAGLIYFNTSTGLNTSQKARLYTGSAWKTIAFSEDLDVAKNEDFLALQRKVDLLSGDVDTDAIISNMKEVSAFLEGFAEDASLMDLLNEKLGKSGGEISGSLAINRFLMINAWEGYGSGAAKLWYDGNKKELQWQGVEKIKIGTNDILTSAGGTIISDVYSPLVIKRSANAGVAIDFKNSRGFLGSIGVHDNGAIFSDSTTTHTLIHSGNVGEYAAKGLNIQTSSDNTRSLFSVWRGNTDADGGDGYVMDFNWNSGNYKAQIYIDVDPTHKMALRQCGNDGIWSDWKTIAFTDSNVVSAQALKHSNGTVGATVDASGNLLLSKYEMIMVTDMSDTARGVMTLNGENILLFGQGTAKAGYDTYIYGNAIRLISSSVGSSTNTAMLINSSGNVTIGASDLAGTDAKLYVGGNISVNGKIMLYDQATTPTPRSVVEYKSNNLHFGYDNMTSAVGYDTYLNGKNVYLRYSGGNTGLLLNSSGNVGIGTTDPKAKLDVAGSVALGLPSSCDIYLNRTNGYNYLHAAHSFAVTVDNNTSNFALSISKNKDAIFYGNLRVVGNLVVDKEVSAGGAAEEGGNAGSGAGAFHSESIAIGATQTTIAHGLGTDDIVVSIYEKDGVSGRWSIILTDVEIVDANNIIVSFGSATSVEHKVVIMGAVA